MGMSPAAFVLFTKLMKFNPSNPEWAARDRFVLSNGHGCSLLYSLLHLTGYKAWTLDVLKSFRQLDSIAAGHPENHFPGIEVSTGPLGQGISNAVGLAMAERQLAATFNKKDLEIVDNYTYVFCGDGCLQEGVSGEAASLAGHLGLGKLIVIYDDNHITIDGETHLSFTEDVLKRYEAYGWHTMHVADGDNDVAAIEAALLECKKVTDKPSIIKLTTTIGFGSAKQGTEGVHGSPLGAADIANVKTKFGLNPELSFHVAPEVAATYNHVAAGEAAEAAWRATFAKYAAAYPAEAAEFERREKKQLPVNWESVVPTYVAGGAALATRKTGGNTLNALAGVLPELFGGSADLNPSTFTYLEKFKPFLRESYDGRNIHFGVREHAMASIMNGIAAYGFFIPFGSSFLNFLGYALGAFTLSALSGLHTLYIFTHDSIGLGEDGPTHQAIEKFMLCRTTPNVLFIRPADGVETSAAYIAAIRNSHGPTLLALSRQNLPQNVGSSLEGALKGAYILSDAASAPNVILTATGSEVEIAIKAAATLTAEGVHVRVVSFPSWELFEQQSQEYKESVFTQGVPVLSIEAGTIMGWSRYAHASIGMTTFGASAPAPQLYKKFGITAENTVEKAKQLITFHKTHPVAHLLQRPF
jgi:transketolase